MMHDLEPRYDVKTVAQRYGKTERTVHNWVKRGWLRAIRPGKKHEMFFTPRDLEEFEARFTTDGRATATEARDGDDDDEALQLVSGE